jgi:hypothetical protein
MKYKILFPKMKIISRVFAPFVLVALVVSCTTQSGPKFPQPSAGYTPRHTYDASFEKVWKTVNDTLDNNRIAVVSSDQAAGRMQTDYIAGPITSYVGFLGGVGTSRYSFSIKVNRQDDGKTKLLIIGKLEQTLHGGQSATPYRDITPQNQAIVTNLENWLYEQIEKGL